MRAACHILICFMLAWYGLTPVATAQDDETRKLEDFASQKALSESDRAAIQSTIEQNLASIESSDAEKVAAASKALRDWSGTPATPVFRGEFSKLACVPLSNVVKRAEPLNAINAIEVLRCIKTYDSLKTLAVLGSSAESPTLNAGVRLSASRAVLAGIREGTDMNSAQAGGLVRLLAEGVKGETEWLSAWSQMSALGLIAKRSGMDAKVISDARRGQVDGLKGIQKKVLAGGAAKADLLKAASRTMNSMFVDLATVPAAERAPVGASLTETLESFQELASSKPAGLQPDVQLAYDDASRAAVKLLGLFKTAPKPAGKPATKPQSKPAPKKPAN
jgi:hypothetical protein